MWCACALCCVKLDGSSRQVGLCCVWCALCCVKLDGSSRQVGLCDVHVLYVASSLMAQVDRLVCVMCMCFMLRQA